MFHLPSSLTWLSQFKSFTPDLHTALTRLIRFHSEEEIAIGLEALAPAIAASGLYGDWEPTFVGYLLSTHQPLRLASLEIITQAIETNPGFSREIFAKTLSFAVHDGHDRALVCAFRMIRKFPLRSSDPLLRKLIDSSISHTSGVVRATLAAAIKDLRENVTLDQIHSLARDFDFRARANTVLSSAVLLHRGQGESNSLKHLIREAANDHHNRVLADSAMAHSLFDRSQSTHLILNLLDSPLTKFVKSGEYAAAKVNPGLMKKKPAA